MAILLPQMTQMSQYKISLPKKQVSLDVGDEPILSTKSCVDPVSVLILKVAN
jgi:hypothetical protein